jgi:hypothetical protein
MFPVVAAWQCDFVLVPASALPAPSAATAPVDLVAAEWWSDAQPPRDFETHIGAILSERSSWSPDLRTWGTEDGTRIDVWREGRRVDSIRVRVDLREPDPDVLRQIVALAAHCSAAFLRSDGLFVPASDDAITSAIATSAAARFVDDSDAFFRRIRLGGPEDA